MKSISIIPLLLACNIWTVAKYMSGRQYQLTTYCNFGKCFLTVCKMQLHLCVVLDFIPLHDLLLYHWYILASKKKKKIACKTVGIRTDFKFTGNIYIKIYLQGFIFLELWLPIVNKSCWKSSECQRKICRLSKQKN